MNDKTIKLECSLVNCNLIGAFQQIQTSWALLCKRTSITRIWLRKPAFSNGEADDQLNSNKITKPCGYNNYLYRVCCTVYYQQETMLCDVMSRSDGNKSIIAKHGRIFRVFFFCRLEGSFEIFTKILASHVFQLPVSILAVSLKKNLNDFYSAIVLGD